MLVWILSGMYLHWYLILFYFFAHLQCYCYSSALKQSKVHVICPLKPWTSLFLANISRISSQSAIKHRFSLFVHTKVKNLVQYLFMLNLGPGNGLLQICFTYFLDLGSQIHEFLSRFLVDTWSCKMWDSNSVSVPNHIFIFRVQSNIRGAS